MLMDMIFLQVLCDLRDSLPDFDYLGNGLKSLSCFVDPFTRLSEDHFSSSLGGYMKDIGSVLELFRVSQIIIHPDAFVLEKLNFWTSHFLIQELSNGSIHADRLNKYISQEVFPAIKPFSLIYCRFTV